MKEISQMTSQEIENEIKEFITNDKGFDASKSYIFVSYSHKDKEEVMRKVLEWIRQGYNVIMDLDFENHGSEESWIDLLCKRIRSDRCVQAACFRSKHYYRSMACLIELLLLRSSFIENKRHSPKYKVIPMDVIDLSAKKIVDEDAEFEKEYEEAFTKMNKRLSTKESQMLRKGLETLCWKSRLKKGGQDIEGKNVDEMVDEYMNNLEESIDDGALDYYSFIQDLFDDWFEYNDMNGNYKDVNYDASTVFAVHDVYRHPYYAENQKLQENGDSEETIVPDSTERNEEENIEEDSNIADIEDEHVPDNKKVFSTTGDITYELYGQKHTGNQSEFMIQIFGSVLKQHQDIIEDAINAFSCLSSVDYSKKENRTDEMKSYFRVCYTAKFAEKKVCIGTAYNMSAKLSLIANLLDFAGEDRDILKIEGLELPVVKNRTKRNSSTSDASGKETYIVDGELRDGTQADMMFDVFEKLVKKCPEKINRLVTLTSVKCASDVVAPGTVDSKPTYFRIYREFEAMGTHYYVGASYGKKDKLRQIRKMIELCDETDDFFKCEGEEAVASSKHKEKEFDF